MYEIRGFMEDWGLMSYGANLPDCRLHRRPAQKLLQITLAMAILAVSSLADSEGRPARVGILGPREEPRFSELSGALRQGLRDHGYSEQAIEILEAQVERGDRPGAQAETRRFVQQGTEVLFVIGSELAKLAREVSAEIPIVFITPGDPVAASLVSSLARPGGKTTAVTFEYPELSGKRLELLKEMDPRIRRVLVLYDPRDASPRQGLAAAREGASKLGLTLVERGARSREEVERGLDALREADALLAVPGGLTSGYYDAMIRAANARKLPTMFHARTRSTVDALMTYGTRDADIARQAARLVDKILKGANAGDLPVERPTRLEFIINLKTAKALGLTIPQSVLIGADEVIR
jgi:putative ABC transport system substrate-binding protein